MLRPTLDREVGSTVTLRHRPAREIVADRHFERLLTALEAATAPVIPRRVLRVFFDSSDGSVGEVLGDIIDAYPQTVSIEVLLEDVHWVGALDQARQVDELELKLAVIAAELEAVHTDLSRWDAFMQGPSWRPADASARMSRAAMSSTDRSHPIRRGRPPERRIEHP
jgi:hypothetical protein